MSLICNFLKAPTEPNYFNIEANISPRRECDK